MRCPGPGAGSPRSSIHKEDAIPDPEKTHGRTVPRLAVLSALVGLIAVSWWVDARPEAKGATDAPDRDTVDLVARSAPALPATAVPAVRAPETSTPISEDETVAWVDGAGIRYSPASAFVMPGERIHLDVPSDGDSLRLERDPARGSLDRVDDDTWIWTAPEEPGLTTLRVADAAASDPIVLRAWTLVPADRVDGGRLNGYRIGRYPTVPLRGDTMYVRPAGFVEVTEENRDLRVSPRFRLRHFETKQGGGFPRYVVLQRRLLTKLELLVDALVDRGYPVRSLHVMSGYRTPSYNSGLGSARYSRHQWGDASDVFVDEDGDGWMDDLDGDGGVGTSDAQVLYQIVDSLDQAIDTRRLLGGLGIYGPRPGVRGPFVHVDARGSRARW